jgi:type 1 glutamine amidotransferase
MKNVMPLSVLGALLAGAAPGQAPQPAPKIQTLIITGQNTAGHDWHATTPVLRKILEDTGKFEVRVTEEFRGAGPETLAPYDLVILSYYDGGKPQLRWGERAENALLEFVRNGKGAVVYHFATAAFNGWTEYEKLCGANWRPNNGHHSARHDYTVTIVDKDHAITRGMSTTSPQASLPQATFPQTNDELYANLKWQPEGTFHVLATAWDDHSLYKPGEKQPIPGPGLNQPVAWTVNYGKGRVFSDVLGHDPEAMKLPGFIALLVRGAEWAASAQ